MASKRVKGTPKDLEVTNTASATIWNREIFAGLQVLFADVFANFGGKKIPVVVRKPDEDFKVESYPCIVLQITGATFSAGRSVKRETVKVSIDKENYTGIIRKTALPYDLALQIDFYSLSENELDSMIIKWLSKSRREFVLNVKNRGGDDDDCLVTPNNGTVELNVVRLDEMNGDDRLFRACMNYTVYGRIEEAETEEVPLLRKVEVTTKTNKYNGRVRTYEKVYGS